MSGLPGPPAPRRSIGGFFTAYFAAGLALLVVGLVVVAFLLLRPPNSHRAAPPARSAGSADSAGLEAALFRRLTAGRTYTTTIVFDVAKPLRGDVVFVWPLKDVIGSWKVG